MCIYFWETEHEWGRSRERETHTHRIRSRLQALRCQHRARHGARTHKPWDHDLSWSRPFNWLSHPNTPKFFFLNKNVLKVLLKALLKITLREREREKARVGEGQREKGRHRIQSRFQALSCQHRARHGAQTHELWDHDLNWSWTLNRLSHPGAPSERES